MKLKNIKEVEEFRKVIHACAGDVYLKSQDGDVFNLKSALSEYIALGQLLSEQGDNLELFADRREDEARLINFLAELDKENENAAVHPAFIDPRRKARIRAVRGNFKKKQTCNPLQSSVSDCGFERRKTFAVEMDAP